MALEQLYGVLHALAHLCGRGVGLVHGHDEHGEAELEEHEDREELAEVDQKGADDDGPRTEEVMERQEVQNLRKIKLLGFKRCLFETLK